MNDYVTSGGENSGVTPTATATAAVDYPAARFLFTHDYICQEYYVFTDMYDVCLSV